MKQDSRVVLWCFGAESVDKNVQRPQTVWKTLTNECGEGKTIKVIESEMR